MNPAPAGYQLPLSFSTPPGSGFGDFVPGSNAEAVSLLQALAAGRESAAVYLWGPPVSGKTHLLYAVCAEVAARGRPAYVPLREARSWAPQVLEGLESADLVCIDDVDAMVRDVDWERGLFHLYNRLRDAGKPIVISGRYRPDLAPVELADLRSRLTGGLVFRLEPPDEAAKIAALQRRARLRGLEVPEAVAHYLLRRCPRDLGSLLKLLDRLDEASLSAQRRLTVPFVRAFLENNHFAATANQ
jgi:DnaA family protein